MKVPGLLQSKNLLTMLLTLRVKADASANFYDSHHFCVKISQGGGSAAAAAAPSPPPCCTCLWATCNRSPASVQGVARSHHPYFASERSQSSSLDMRRRRPGGGGRDAAMKIL
jgi:hypothetical protein